MTTINTYIVDSDNIGTAIHNELILGFHSNNGGMKTSQPYKLYRCTVHFEIYVVHSPKKMHNLLTWLKVLNLH